MEKLALLDQKIAATKEKKILLQRREVTQYFNLQMAKKECVTRTIEFNSRLY